MNERSNVEIDKDVMVMLEVREILRWGRESRESGGCPIYRILGFCPCPLDHKNAPLVLDSPIQEALQIPRLISSPDVQRGFAGACRLGRVAAAASSLGRGFLDSDVRKRTRSPPSFLRYDSRSHHEAFPPQAMTVSIPIIRCFSSVLYPFNSRS